MDSKVCNTVYGGLENALAFKTYVPSMRPKELNDNHCTCKCVRVCICVCLLGKSANNPQQVMIHNVFWVGDQAVQLELIRIIVLIWVCYCKPEECVMCIKDFDNFWFLLISSIPFILYKFIEKLHGIEHILFWHSNVNSSKTCEFVMNLFILYFKEKEFRLTKSGYLLRPTNWLSHHCNSQGMLF